jgi:DNA-binding MarR family transcriptional regulator
MKKLLYLKDHQLKQYIEKIFNGYRETVADAKKVLEKHELGTAHNKVIHLLSLYEGITISTLLRKLKVTKQSLNRVLNDLVKINAIEFKRDEIDTRVKHIYLTDEGKKIFDEIFTAQKKRIYDAFLSSESGEVISFDKVLKKIINEKI